MIVEVHAGQRSEAMALLENRKTELKISRRASPRLAAGIAKVRGGFGGALFGLPAMVLLVRTLAKFCQFPSISARNQILWGVFAIGWICCIAVGVLVAAWLHKRSV